MVFFIDLLRTLAMVLITNSHYVGVYPNDIIANGGLLGNVIFFAVSGFCLSNIKLPFHKWYAKRILRIYPIVWVIILFYWAIGEYTITGVREFFSAFIFPTRHHFIGAIILLYIPYYIVAYLEKHYGERLKGKFDFIAIVFAAVIGIQLLVYVFAYDKSYYHIDTVLEPMIHFLYFEAMLIGLYIKKHLDCFQDKKGILKYVITAVTFVLYFASKMLFSHRVSISSLQIVNQYVLLVCMTGIILCVAGLSSTLEKLPAWIKKVVSWFARITLEIYVVQSVIIMHFKTLQFPLNWLVITAVICLAGAALHYVIESPKIFKKLLSKRKG